MKERMNEGSEGKGTYLPSSPIDFNSQDPHGGRTILTPTTCPLTSTCA